MSLPVYRAPAHSRSRLLALAGALALLGQAQAQVNLDSVVPPMGATGVSPTAAVSFTFSDFMDPSLTEASFMVLPTMTPLPTLASWNTYYTVLTCTPTEPFPANKMIVWTLDGESLFGDPVSEGGYFTTGGSGGGTGSCSTNEQSSFTLGKACSFSQTSTAAPTRNAYAPYGFVACTTIACTNGSASGVSVTSPLGAATNLTALALPGHFTAVAAAPDQPTLEGAFPNGPYIFNVQATPANQQFTLNFPSSLVTPNAPHLTNFTAAQAVDPSQPFVLGWDPFEGGTAADCIYVEIYGGAFSTPAPVTPGALDGTARSVVIPAGTLQPETDYTGAITFYDLIVNTNTGGYLSLMYRASVTEFTLSTRSAAPSLLVITNAARTGDAFSFEVISSPGQALVIETNSALLPGQWQTWLTTNSPTGRIQLNDPRALTDRYLFYRVRRGP